MLLQKNDVVLFQGDSITDCGRNRSKLQGHDHEALGHGYALFAAAQLLARHADWNLTFLNRGIGGNKIWQLAERWQADCLDLKPTVVSILIGVNDTWHGKGGRKEGVPLDQFESTFRTLLQNTRAALPGARLLLCEPFVLKCGAVTEEWFPEMDLRRGIVHKLAGEFQVPPVAFQATFDAAVKTQPHLPYWLGDGVHPSLAGHMLMAQSWIQALSR